MKKFLVILMALFVAMPVTAGAALIDFSTIPIAVAVGDPISTQYSAYGVVFLPGLGSDIPTIAIDTWTAGNLNVLSTASGLGLGAGDFTIQFTSPVTNVSFDSGMWDGLNGNVDIYDPSNNLLGSFANGSLDVYRFDFGSTVISMIYFDSTFDLNGASITNLSFTPVSVPEPGTMILLGSGLAGLATYRRKRRKK